MKALLIKRFKKNAYKILKDAKLWDSIKLVFSVIKTSISTAINAKNYHPFVLRLIKKKDALDAKRVIL